MADPALPPWKPAPLLQVTAGAHVAGAVALGLVPSAWPLVLGTLAINHAVVCGAVMSPRSRLLGPNLSRLPPAASASDPSRSAGARVALTFDDGPDPQVTPKVLDLLAEGDARGTFFCIGQRAEEHPGLVAEIVSRGHRVENHTYRHAKTFAFFGPRTQAAEVDRAQEVLEDLAGRRPVFVRAPAGFRNIWLDRILHRRGLRLASWSRRGYDTVDGRPERVARRVLRGLSPGDVVLLHDGASARDQDGRPVVLEVLPRLLDELAARGWRTAFLPAGPHGEP